MKVLEGSTFGFCLTGVFDGPVFLVQRLVAIEESFASLVLDSGIWDAVCHQMNIATTENELSPQGLVSATRYFT